ncbi:GTP-binding protein [Methylococcus capsulatus]|nr:GTPase domain-containing protein [Methylococcus sp. BF19-07]MDF9391668.1 GTP-binding protein [Methylococcus capsulatus]
MQRGGPVRNALQVSTGDGPCGPALRQFLARLEKCYVRKDGHLAKTGAARPADHRRNLYSLQLANLRLRWLTSDATLPQITVIGPTQAGKSSVINWLVGENAAVASPLAGFTRHPQGFAYGAEREAVTALYRYFEPLQARRIADLPAEDFRFFGFEAEHAGLPRLGCPVTVWDTPDFDSIDSERYRGGLLRAIALSDLLVCVLSKDKYADQSVWELLAMIEPLGIPSFICLNKTPAAAVETVVRSLTGKWRHVRGDATPPIIALPYLTADALEPPGVDALVEAARTLLRQTDRSRQTLGLIRFLRANWESWLAPVRLEQNAEQEWRALVGRAMVTANRIYRRDYLDHPHHYETFQRALAELLTLLEIPGVARLLTQMRRIMTWPVRQLGQLGRRWRPDAASLGNEQSVLQQIALHVMLTLRQEVAEIAENATETRPWWLALGRELGQKQAGAVGRFSHAASAYAREFEPEVEKTAHALYDRLREHPAVLNSLRATRVTTDAAALAVGLHTGGIGLQDFVIAPAILSLTSLLTESALGHYVQRAAEDLKRRQATAVSDLFNDHLAATLLRLPEDMAHDTGFFIPVDTIEAAERELAVAP